jgi:hypothetical protein
MRNGGKNATIATGRRTRTGSDDRGYMPPLGPSRSPSPQWRGSVEIVTPAGADINENVGRKAVDPDAVKALCADRFKGIVVGVEHHKIAGTRQQSLFLRPMKQD